MSDDVTDFDKLKLWIVPTKYIVWARADQTLMFRGPDEMCVFKGREAVIYDTHQDALGVALEWQGHVREIKPEEMESFLKECWEWSCEDYENGTCEGCTGMYEEDDDEC